MCLVRPVYYVSATEEKVLADDKDGLNDQDRALRLKERMMDQTDLNDVPEHLLVLARRLETALEKQKLKLKG